jgi:[ribosomal protein S5]-alanine N-acetyltransferase
MAGVLGLMPEIDAGRVTLRLASPGMEEAHVRFLEENHANHLARWSPPPAPGFFTRGFWEERLAASLDEYRAGRSLRLVMQLPGTSAGGEILGTINYTNIVRGAFQACHLGYQIAAAHEGRGLMTEALRAGNAFVFDEVRLHRIMANYRPENERSARVLERLGFVREGFARDYLFIDGAWRDHVLTALVNPAHDPAWLVPDR